MATTSREDRKKDCRNKYKELLERGHEVDEQVQIQDIPKIIDKITGILDSCETNANTFFKEDATDNATDCLMDVNVLAMAHQLVSATTEKLAHSEFQENEFLVGLIEILNSDNPEKLAQMAVTCCRSVQLQLAMLGTFDIEAAPREQKIRKARQTQKKDIGPKLAPENVTQIVKKDKGAEKINDMRKEIFRVCNERKTDHIPYFELIINPKSFMKTVDNAFQIAFLIRDGYLGLKRINHEPHIYLPQDNRHQSQNRTQREGPEETVQTVMSINPQMWKEGIEKFKLKAPLLKLEANNANIEDSSEDDSDD